MAALVEIEGRTFATATTMHMKTYRMIVREGADGEPLELVAKMASDLRAADFARQRIAADPRIREIEIWTGDTRLCRLQARGASAVPSAVQLGVVAENALLVERNATRRG
jgi:hypothetical protein